MSEEYGLTLSSTTQRARKPYTCDDCGYTIHKGEQYIRMCILQERQKFTWRRCDCCDAWIETPGLVYEIQFWEQGRVWDSISERFDQRDGWIHNEVAV